MLLSKYIQEAAWEVPEPPNPCRRYVAFKTTMSTLTAVCILNSCPARKRRNLYIDREAMRLKKKKRKLWSSYSQTLDPTRLARYKRCSSDLRRLTRKLRVELERKPASGIKGNSQGFWRYVSSRTKTRTGVETSGRLQASLQQATTERPVLGTFFSSVCTEDDLSPIATTAEAFEGSAVEDVTATAELVRHKLSQLKTSSAAGPDGTHPRILQETEMHWRPNSQASTERDPWHRCPPSRLYPG